MNNSYRRKVKRTIDGDTIELYRGISGSRRVRLTDYDAPERYQCGGQKATNTLRGMVGGQVVTIMPVGFDSYGRVLGTLYCRRHNVNKRMRRRLS